MNATDYLVLGLLVIGYGLVVGEWPPLAPDETPGPFAVGFGLLLAAALRGDRR